MHGEDGKSQFSSFHKLHQGCPEGEAEAGEGDRGAEEEHRSKGANHGEEGGAS